MDDELGSLSAFDSMTPKEQAAVSNAARSSFKSGNEPSQEQLDARKEKIAEDWGGLTSEQRNYVVDKFINNSPLLQRPEIKYNTPMGLSEEIQSIQQVVSPLQVSNEDTIDPPNVSAQKDVSIRQV